MSLCLYIFLFFVGTESTDMSRFPRVPKPDYQNQTQTEYCTFTNTTLSPDVFATQCGNNSAYPYVELRNCSYFCCVNVENSTINSIQLYNAVDYVNCGNEIYAAATVRGEDQGSC